VNINKQCIMVASDAQHGYVREFLAEIIHPDIALHHTLVYIGADKYDFTGKGWTITHIPTGFALLVMDEVFGHTTAVSLARKFIPYIDAAPKYIYLAGDNSEAQKWARFMYNDDFMDFKEFHKSLRFFNDTLDGFYWNTRWDKTNRDKWRK